MSFNFQIPGVPAFVQVKNIPAISPVDKAAKNKIIVCIIMFLMFLRLYQFTPAFYKHQL